MRVALPVAATPANVGRLWWYNPHNLPTFAGGEVRHAGCSVGVQCGGGVELVELEGIEPSSVRRLAPVLRPFPSLSLHGWLTAGSVGLRPPPRLSEVPMVFPIVSGLSRRQSPLLLPGCEVQAPRAIAGRDDSRFT